MVNLKRKSFLIPLHRIFKKKNLQKKNLKFGPKPEIYAIGGVSGLMGDIKLGVNKEGTVLN